MIIQSKINDTKDHMKRRVRVLAGCSPRAPRRPTFALSFPPNRRLLTPPARTPNVPPGHGDREDEGRDQVRPRLRQRPHVRVLLGLWRRRRLGQLLRRRQARAEGLVLERAQGPGRGARGGAARSRAEPARAEKPAAAPPAAALPREPNLRASSPPLRRGLMCALLAPPAAAGRGVLPLEQGGGAQGGGADEGDGPREGVRMDNNLPLRRCFIVHSLMPCALQQVAGSL